jgi:hypothetical protein
MACLAGDPHQHRKAVDKDWFRMFRLPRTNNSSSWRASSDTGTGDDDGVPYAFRRTPAWRRSLAPPGGLDVTEVSTPLRGDYRVLKAVKETIV